MLGKLIPVILALVGLGAGIGAGLVLRPAAETDAASQDETGHEEAAVDADGNAVLPEFVKLNNQFVVPVIEDGRVASMVIMSLSLEVTAGSTVQVYEREPKLRDVFLQVLFDHANSGGFRGSFTDGANLVLLRKALHEAALGELGDIVTDVLITEIIRQDS